ncbi:Peptidase A1 domain-containing protein [Aphelenchoides fujianensis]|nr:Peptidase A1 domain-containing protein [Aphelenchoides fujianensis]
MLAQLEQPVFSIWLDRHVKPPKDRAGGVITFGAVDWQNCDPAFVYVALVREAEWIFNVDAVDYADLHNSSVLQAVSDTSSLVILVAFEIFPFILRVINATYDSRYGLYAVPCTSAADLPDLVLTVGGQQLHVPGTECALLMDAQSE